VYFLVRSWVGLDSAALWSGQRPGFAAYTPPWVIGWAALVVALMAILAVQELWDYFDALRLERDTDVLTGVLNRRGFQAKVERMLASADHAESTLLVFDLDKFKPVNDRLGHAAGDDVLRNFVTVMQSVGRRSDVVGRLGGDEFAVFLDGATYADALHVGQRIRRELARAPFNHFAETVPVTVSFGIAKASPHTVLADVISAADEQLCRAKKRAGNGA
jgi:diguanylate cyclase (GGDEF)-like protein